MKTFDKAYYLKNHGRKWFKFFSYGSYDKWGVDTFFEAPLRFDMQLDSREERWVITEPMRSRIAAKYPEVVEIEERLGEAITKFISRPK